MNFDKKDGQILRVLFHFGIDLMSFFLALIFWSLGFKSSRLTQNLDQVQNIFHFDFSRWRFYKNLSYDLLILLFGSKYETCIIDESSQLALENLKKGRAIVLGMHYGNHELMAHFLVNQGVPFVAMALPLKNKFFHKLLQNRRQSWGVKTDRFQYARNLIDEVNSGSVLGLMVDQNPKKTSGRDQMFLGVEAKTSLLPDFVIQHTQAAIFAVILLKESNSYRLYVQEMNELTWWEEHRIWFESFILRAPEFWYGWLHRRFNINYSQSGKK
jgi:lauroyl/myristoyl acyltransferase